MTLSYIYIPGAQRYGEGTPAARSICKPELRVRYHIRDLVKSAASGCFHKQTRGVKRTNITREFERYPKVVAFSRYGFRIVDVVKDIGLDRVFTLGLDARQVPQQRSLNNAAEILSYPGKPLWLKGRGHEIASADRQSRLPLHGPLVDFLVARVQRGSLVPRALRYRIEEVFANGYSFLKRLMPRHAHLSAYYPALVP